ncbi:MAG: hypothetical protein JWP89_6701 [Schlesneria sp.]|nr:hypothetical protein [Schlesneria sp.]
MADRWTMAAEKLIALTQAGEVQWQPSQDISRRRSTADIVGPAYVAEVDGKQIAVFEYQFKNFHDEDEWHWDTGVTVEFVDENYDTEWVWPSTGGSRFALLDAVRYQAAAADDFLSRFLEKPKVG